MNFHWNGITEAEHIAIGSDTATSVRFGPTGSVFGTVAANVASVGQALSYPARAIPIPGSAAYWESRDNAIQDMYDASNIGGTTSQTISQLGATLEATVITAGLFAPEAQSAAAECWPHGLTLDSELLQLGPISDATMQARQALVESWANELGFEGGQYVHGVYEYGTVPGKTLSTQYIVGGGCTPEDTLIITGHAFEQSFLDACSISSPRVIAAHEWAHLTRAYLTESEAMYRGALLANPSQLGSGSVPWLTPAEADELHALGRLLK